MVEDINDLSSAECLSLCFPNTVQGHHLFLLDIQELIFFNAIVVSDDWYLPSKNSKKEIHRTIYTFHFEEVPDKFPYLKKLLTLFLDGKSYTFGQIATKVRKEFKNFRKYKSDILFPSLISKRLIKTNSILGFNYNRLTTSGDNYVLELENFILSSERNFSKFKSNNEEFIQHCEKYGNKINLINYIWLKEYLDWNEIFKQINAKTGNMSYLQNGIGKFTNQINYLGIYAIGGYSISAGSFSYSSGSFSFGGGSFGGGGASGSW